MSANSIAKPEFTGLLTDQQLFDVWDSYYTDVLGPMFPRAVSLPVGGVPTEEGRAIFGTHLEAMEQTRREWEVASRLYLVIRDRLESGVPLKEDGETVLALPRADFTEEQNSIAQEGVLLRGLSIFADRRGLSFPEHFDASWDLPRYTKVLDDGSVELLQEQDTSIVEESGIATRGAYVAVKRLYGPTHQAHDRDVRAITMLLTPRSNVTAEHQAHPAIHDTYGDKNKTLDLGDNAIVERLNGQRPRPKVFGTGLIE